MTSLYDMKMPHLKTLYEYMVATATEMVHVPELSGILVSQNVHHIPYRWLASPPHHAHIVLSI